MYFKKVNIIIVETNCYYDINFLSLFLLVCNTLSRIILFKLFSLIKVLVRTKHWTTSFGMDILRMFNCSRTSLATLVITPK